MVFTEQVTKENAAWLLRGFLSSALLKSRKDFVLALLRDNLVELRIRTVSRLACTMNFGKSFPEQALAYL